MALITVASSKGGVGKTTVALHLATMFARQGRTLLIDGDPQASAAKWAGWRRDTAFEPSPVTTRLNGKEILSEGQHLSTGYEHTVIDVGGRDSAGLRYALLLAKLAIIPIGASNLDAAAMTDLLEVVEVAKTYNPELELRVLLTRVDPRTKDAADMLGFLEELKLTVLKAKSASAAFRRAIGEGPSSRRSE
jgi:chromosome partitioning protein